MFVKGLPLSLVIVWTLAKPDPRIDVNIDININGVSSVVENSKDSTCLLESFGSGRSKNARSYGRSMIPDHVCAWHVGCSKSYPAYPEFPPIIVTAAQWHRIILPEVVEGLPPGITAAWVPVGSTLLIACPGSNFKNFNKQKYISATCDEDRRLHVNGESFSNIESMGCEEMSKSSIEVPKFNICGDNSLGERNQIGFKMSDTEFTSLIDVCFLKTTKNTLWAKHDVRGLNYLAKMKFKRKDDWFNDPGFFSLDDDQIKDIYTQAAQGSYLREKKITKPAMIKSIKDNIYAKGHLANADAFITKAEVQATFHYINALPQWQVFNNGNWKRIEKWVIDLAKQLEQDLQIFSGGYDTLNLRNTQGNPTLYFYLGKMINDQFQDLAVPAALWKLVIDDVNKKAVLFIVSNNPQLIHDLPPGIDCVNMCGGLSNLDVDTNAKGRTLCCQLNQPNNMYPPNLPFVSYSDLLNFPAN